jgi:hypothetical protein
MQKQVYNNDLSFSVLVLSLYGYFDYHYCKCSVFGDQILIPVHI